MKNFIKIVALSVAIVVVLCSCGSLSDGNANRFKWAKGIFVEGSKKDTGDKKAVSDDTEKDSDDEYFYDDEDTPFENTSVSNNATNVSSNTSGQGNDNGNTSKPTEPTNNTPKEIVNVENVIREEAIALRLNETVLERSIVNVGDMTRVANVIKKAVRGEPVTIGAIGGSITEGTGASPTSNRYADRFKTWWANTFPDSQLTYINAGIGATDSLVGVHRAEADILNKNPDLVIVDFSVNDSASNATIYRESYESLIRRILKKSNNPAVICVCMFNETGESVQTIHAQVAKHNNVPMVSYKDAVWPQNGAKVYAWSEIGADNVHPNNTGHAVISELLIYYINTVRAKLTEISETVAPLGEPLTESGFENGVLYTNQTLTASSLGSFKLTNNAFRQFKMGWTVSGGTNPIEFQFKNAKSIYLLYRKYTSNSGGTVALELDGNVVGSANADFAGGWGEYATFEKILDSNTASDHVVKLRLTSDSPKTDFAILGMMVSY